MLQDSAAKTSMLSVTNKPTNESDHVWVAESPLLLPECSSTINSIYFHQESMKNTEYM